MTSSKTIEQLATQEYKYGFVTAIDSDTMAKGLSEETIRVISARKSEPQFMLDWRLKAYRHWLTMREPRWAHVTFPPIDYQDMIYYSSPKMKTDSPKSLDEIDPELRKTYEKLGISLDEQ